MLYVVTCILHTAQSYIGDGPGTCGDRGLYGGQLCCDVAVSRVLSTVICNFYCNVSCRQ